MEEILSTGQVALSVSELFQSPEEVVISSVEVTDPSGSISDEELDQRVEVVSFEKKDCKNGGWKSLLSSDGTAFENQKHCKNYVNTGSTELPDDSDDDSDSDSDSDSD